MKPKLFSAAALVMALTACSTQPLVVSRALDSGKQPAIDGLAYSLPKSILRIKIADRVTTIGPVEQIPNPAARYVLEGRHAVLSNDVFTFEVSNGLLESATANSTDLTPTIVEEITTSVGELLRNDAARVREAEQPLPNAEFVINPLEFGHHHIEGYSVQVTPIDGQLDDRMKKHVREYGSCNGASICVPVLTPVKVKVSSGKGSASVETVVTVVDPTRALGIRFNRAACAAAENAVTLNAGIVTKYSVDRPSEIAACLKIPLNILSAIVAAPVDAITGRTRQIAAETELLEAQAALLAQRNALLDQQLAAQQSDE